jgi:gas vesicle protein
MFSRVRIAIRFFFMGLAVGVLLAPRSGKETRRLVRERADRLLNDLLDAATLGSFDSGAGADVESEDGETKTRSGNGRSRSRSTAQAQA